jgi:adenylate cyclase
MTIMRARYHRSDSASVAGGAATVTAVQHPDEQRWIDAGLLDQASPATDGRRALLTWLSGRGVTVDDMVRAAAQGQLTSVAADLAVRPGPRLSPREVAASVDIDLQLVHDVRRASGLRAVADDERGLTDGDFALLELFKAASAFFSHDEVLRFSAVVGSAMRRIADAADEMFLRDVEAPLKVGGESSELEMAQASLLAVELAQVSTGIFAPMFLGHFETSTQLTRLARRNSDDYETVPLAIGFVDLSGFTERSSTLSPRELRDLVVDFEMRASGIVGDHDGRVIKLIGDEVMFSAIDAEALCSIALALTEAAPSDIPARGGLASGEVVASGGDLFGPVVNLASRIADIAIPGEVLVDSSVAQAAPSMSFEPAGRRSLKGFSEPVHVWTLTRS